MWAHTYAAAKRSTPGPHGLEGTGLFGCGWLRLSLRLAAWPSPGRLGLRPHEKPIVDVNDRAHRLFPCNRL